MERVVKGILFLCCILISVSVGEKVGSIRYKGYPEYLDGRTIKREDDIVALAERITAFDSSSSFSSGGGATSVMLVMDHSTSMLLNLVGNTNPQPKDPDGVRYKVATKLVEELQKLSPETEVGLSIFSSYLYLDPDDDPLFEELDVYKEYSKIQGGFIPLLKLNKEVTKGNNAGMTGAEVIKKYLETRDTTVTYKGGVNNFKKLAYEPTNSLLDPLRVKEVHNQSSGTNIWAGFAAAKEAMLQSTVPKKNQFIIFFSDGAHSHIPSGTGPGNNDWDEVTAPDVPTTFCVYFNVAGVAWPMEDFLEFIQTNGYSSSNPQSSFEKMSAGEDEVMKYMKESVISKIVTNTTYVTPKEITVNGEKSSNWIKNSDWFDFGKLFALGKNGDTDFDMSLLYSRKVVDANSGVETPLTDTTINISFSVSENSGESLGDSLDLRYWGRTLALFNGSTEITDADVIDESVTDLTIKFESYEVDTTYDYSTVPVTVTTVNGTDSEVVSLTQSGGKWSVTLPREEGGANSGDGTIQHQNPDTLVFTFHNPDLPLDTLQVKRYYYQESSGITLQSGSLYDNDGDGLADSISIAFSGKDAETVKNEIVNALTLPDDRNFTINTSDITGSTLGLSVTQGSGTIKTITDATDTVLVKGEVILNDKLFLNPCRFTLADKMAAVIMSASVVDSAEESSRDELTVTFSEDIDESSIATEPFELYRTSVSNSYSAELSVINFSNDAVLFEILSVDGDPITQGDSIRIEVNSNLKDDKGNAQKADENLRREIDVDIIDKTMSLGDAAYFDRDADGFVDSISLQIRGGDVPESDLSGLVSELKLPSHRDFRIDNTSYNSGTLALVVTEQSGNILTATDNRDELMLEDTFFLSGSDAFIVPGTVPINDNLAPIVMSASVIDSAKEGSRDELTVTFSEELADFSTETPFNFYRGTSEYSVTLASISESGTTYEFEILTLSGQDRIEQGDSLHFNSEKAIADSKGNGQDNSDNIKREIDVTLIEEGIQITSADYYDTDADGFIDSIECQIYGKESLIDKYLDTIVASLELNDDRDFEITSYKYKNGSLTLDVTEQSSKANTACGEKDRLQIKESILIESDSTLILPCDVNCGDNLAPVILEASVVDSQIVVLIGEKDSLYTNANGELTVRFSEEVEKHFMAEPFRFYHDGDEYATMVEMVEHDGDELLYQIMDIDGREKITDGDSIHVRADENSDLTDLLTLKQLNGENIKRPITVETFYDTIRVPAPYNLEFKSTVLKRGYDDEESRSDDSIAQMVMIIEPDTKENFCDADSMAANFRVFDPVGNEVTETLSFDFVRENKRLLFFWNGKNIIDRKVGRGSYAVVAEIVLYFEGEVKERKIINAQIGVQEKK